MSGNRFAWLYLTDLHYGLDGQDCLWLNLLQPFLNNLTRLHDRCGPWHAVLFTGDLVQSAKPEQFQAMQQEFLDPLWERLHGLGSGEANLLAVPGNHDLSRPNPVEQLLDAENLVIEDTEQVSHATEWYKMGADFSDALHLAVCGEMTMHTFDRGFYRRAREARLAAEVKVLSVNKNP